MEQGVASTRHKDRFFNFNMIDQSKSNFRKSEKNRFSESRFNQSSKNRLKIDITSSNCQNALIVSKEIFWVNIWNSLDLKETGVMGVFGVAEFESTIEVCAAEKLHHQKITPPPPIFLRFWLLPAPNQFTSAAAADFHLGGEEQRRTKKKKIAPFLTFSSFFLIFRLA